MNGHGLQIFRVCMCYYWILGVRLTEVFVRITEVRISEALLDLEVPEQTAKGQASFVYYVGIQ